MFNSPKKIDEPLPPNPPLLKGDGGTRKNLDFTPLSL